ncbi:helix-turn-helix transcriptional regulator [Smaragdicoccus niigatensis]|uniref:helix-turn-helix transcriptional regulator n=1 Tax=Smaragdicoccus niigatensis TaxID=359359 RepID=UPI0009DC11C6|nr:LuxR family transcriptional regulator [Smaragdicoccus niigatensis]
MRSVQAALSTPDVAGIVIFGAAGVGKSRIAREALAAEASRGRETRWAAATSVARGLPLGVFAPWTSATATDTPHVIREVINALVSSPTGVPPIVCIDDAYLLDDLSTFVVHQIVERGAAKVILTIRDGEPIPPAVQAIWRGGRFDRLDVSALSREETSRLVSTTLGGALDPDAARRLWTLTHGNALYLRTIVEQEVADGRLAQQHGYWRWTGNANVPHSLAELIESRIGALSASAGDVIDVVAVGEPIDLASLTNIADPQAVEEAESRGLLVLERDGSRVQVRLAHPLYGEVRRARGSSMRFARLRGRVAAELAAFDDGTDMRMAVRRATLSLDAEITPDPDLFVRAAQGALWLADLPLAERLADIAIRAGAGADASFIRAHALGWLARGHEADAVLGAVDITTLTTAGQARLAFLRASNRLWALCDPAGAKQLINDASNLLPLEDHACIQAFLTVYWAAMGNCTEATSASKSLSLEELPNIIGVETAFARTIASGGGGRTTEAIAAAETAYSLVNETYDAPHMRFVVADSHVAALGLAGRVSEASDVAQGLEQFASDMPGAAALLNAAVGGCAALTAGDLRSACSLLQPVVELLSAGETSHVAYRYQLPLAMALAMRGSSDQAAAWLSRLDPQQAATWRYVDYERRLACAWLAASQGAITEAIATARSGAEAARANLQFAAEVVCLQTAAQFGDRSCAARLHELEDLTEGPRVVLAARFAAALTSSDGVELAAVSEEFEGTGDIIAALDSAAHAAIAFRSQGRRGSALGSAARADALAQRTGAATPALREGASELPLTDREREIAMLIGQGLSNRAIGERLTLSHRTVENHIHRALTKTGTTTRDELAALLPR